MAEKIEAEIDSIISNNKVVVFSKSWCPFCREVSVLLQSLGVADLKVVEADNRSDENQFMDVLKAKSKQAAVPQVYIGQKLVPGEKNDGYDDTTDLHKKGELKPMLEKLGALDADTDLPASSYDFDLFVLGGGSGGCAAALEAAKVEGRRLAVADFVKPSTQGTTWGVGGTCVNVGCIPKKLMHIAATKGEATHDLAAFGWTLESGEEVKVKHDWDQMCQGIRKYIKESLNQGMIDGFAANKVAYFNSYATLKDRHTLELDDGKTRETKTAKYIMLAAGGRPNDGGYPGVDVPGVITSDDLFWMKDPPGKTLVVGAAYIALECAGFLTGMGYDTTVMVRSMLLRGFDRECVDKIDAYMVEHGTKFIRGSVPKRFEKGESKRVKAFWDADGAEQSEEYDTVLLAIGRKGEATKLGLENAGVWFNPKDGKVVAPTEQTNVSNIFCIGDLVADRPELTPVAKVAGKKVIERIFEGNHVSMDYTKIATTVFTPLEYGMVGLNEEQAKELHGPDGYVKDTKGAKPLERAIVPGAKSDCFFKCLTEKKSGRIIGFHILGPGAGEMIQCMALAIKLKAKKADLDETVGIHPTLAETMTMMKGAPIKGVVCES